MSDPYETIRNGIGFAVPSPADVLAEGAALPAVCIVLLGLRLYARKMQRLGWGMDDLCMAASLAGLIVMGGSLIYGVKKHALAYPSPDESHTSASRAHLPDVIVLSDKIVYAFFIAMAVSLGFVKLAILLFFRRLFIVHRRTILDRLTMGAIVLIAAHMIVFIFVFIFSCGTHMTANWASYDIKRQYCNIQFPSYEAFAISDFILDVLVMSFPFPIVWRLRLSTPRKFAVCAVFALAWLAVAASIARMVVYVRILGGGPNEARMNVNLVITVSLYWSTMEAGVAWIAACLPVLSAYSRKIAGSDAFSAVRQALSIRTLSSKASKDSNQSLSATGASSTNGQYVHRLDSDAGDGHGKSDFVTKSNTGRSEAYADRDVEMADFKGQPADSKRILVKSEVSTYFTQVPE